MLNAQEIIAKGISGKRVGEIIKMSKQWTDEEKKSFLESGVIPERKENKFIVDENSVLRWMIEMESFLPQSSNSEKKRMLDNQCVLINGIKVSHDDTIPPLIESFVLFPENKIKRCTLL
jgi:hypothetical protein